MSNILESVKNPRFVLEELLKPDAKILYEVLFSTKHAGRIYDLVLFETQGFIQTSSNPEDTEFKLRQLLELHTFNAWLSHRKNQKTKCVEIEIGWDDERMLIASSYYSDSITARLQQKIEESGDGLIVRFDPRTKRTQVLSFLSPKEAEKIFATQYVETELSSLKTSTYKDPSLAVPTPLGREKLMGFLNSEKETQNQPQEPLEMQAETVELPPEDSMMDNNMSSSKESPDKSLEFLEQYLQNLFSSMRAQLNNLCTDLPDNEFEKLFPFLEQHIHSLTTRVFTHFSDEAAPENISLLNLDQDLETAPELLRLAHSRVERATHEHGDASSSNMNATKYEETSEVFSPEHSVAPDGAHSQDGNATKYNEPVSTAEIENTLKKNEESLKNAVTEYSMSLENSELPPQAKEWAKGFMENMMKDRAELNNQMRESEKFLKSKEYDFIRKETAFKEQLRIKDAELRQKELALKQTKDALANAHSTIEKVRQPTSSEDITDTSGVLRKLVAAEKMLMIAKETNEQIVKRAEEIQKKFTTEFNIKKSLQQDLANKNKQIADLQRQLLAKGSQVAGQVVNQYKKELELVQKVNLTLKQQIKELHNRLSQAATTNKKPGVTDSSKPESLSGASDAEIKHKLDQATKLNRAIKDELERYRKRFEELKQEETRLRIELGSLQTKLQTHTRASRAKTS